MSNDKALAKTLPAGATLTSNNHEMDEVVLLQNNNSRPARLKRSLTQRLTGRMKKPIVKSNNTNSNNNSNSNNREENKWHRRLSKLMKLFEYEKYYKGKKGEVRLSAGEPRVPPLRPAHIPPDKVPGVIGLRNHGNTCFMNAVLQCLSHTDILAEYFVLDIYKADLLKGNKCNSKKYGTKGEITEQLALLLKAIWSCQYNPEMSTAFKSVVDKYGSQYRGNLQHDAQEFLLWLLDKVHEDLNQASKRKSKAVKVR